MASVKAVYDNKKKKKNIYQCIPSENQVNCS